jgi:PAS domain S-box-containing protein
VSLASAVVIAALTVGLQPVTVEVQNKIATEMEAQWRIYTCFFEVDQTYATLLENHCDLAQGSSAQASDDPSGFSERFVLYGDSLAAHLYPGLVRVLGEDKIIQLTGGSCSAMRMTKGRRCTDFYDWFVDDYVPNNRVDGIIVSSEWLGTYNKVGDEEFRVHLDALFAKLKGHRVIVYSQPGKFSVNIHRYIYKLGKFEEDVPNTLDLETQSLEAVNAALSEEAAKFGFEFIDIEQLFCSSSQCRVVKDGVVYFGDKLYLTMPGSVLAAELTHGILTRGYEEELPGAVDRSTKDHTISTDALMVRNLDGTIRYWSDGARKLYGWEPSEALGTTSHQLLKTVFPVPLEVIEEELRAKGRWEGQLVHVLRDGSRVTVVSHWVTEQSPHSRDGSIRVIEVNSPLNASSGSFRDELLSLLNQPRCFNRQPACQTVS